MAQFNSYKRLTCSNNKLDLMINLASNKINVTWPVVFSDMRRLNGYTLSYIEAAGNLTFDPNDISSSISQCSDEWSTEYIQHDTRHDRFGKYFISEVIQVKPYRRVCKV
jgi:hypothetical protein